MLPPTRHLLVEVTYRSVGIVNDLVHLYVQVTVLVGQRLGEIFLVYADGSQWDVSPGDRDRLHLLRGLVSPECKTSAGAFHDSRWAHATEDTCLVVLGRVEQGRNGIVWIG